MKEARASTAMTDGATRETIDMSTKRAIDTEVGETIATASVIVGGVGRVTMTGIVTIAILIMNVITIGDENIEVRHVIGEITDHVTTDTTKIHIIIHIIINLMKETVEMGNRTEVHLLRISQETSMCQEEVREDTHVMTVIRDTDVH